MFTKKQNIVFVMVCMLGLVLLVLIPSLLILSNSTDNTKRISQSSHIEKAKDDTETKEFIVYKIKPTIINNDENRIGLKNEEYNVEATNPDLYSFCKNKIGEKVTVTYKIKPDGTGLDYIKVTDKEE